MSSARSYDTLETIMSAVAYVTNSLSISVTPRRVSVVFGRYFVMSSSTLTQPLEKMLNIPAKMKSRKNRFLLSTINVASDTRKFGFSVSLILLIYTTPI